MPNIQCTDFSNRKGSPFQKEICETITARVEDFKISPIEKNKKIQTELIDKVNKKAAEIASTKQAHRDGVFTEVVTHGAFTKPKTSEVNVKTTATTNPTTTVPKSLLGFPSSANTLALEAKADLESDQSISQEVKDKVISKLFLLANMVQHMYESKVRIAGDFEKFKDKHLKDESRREREHSEQLYKLNMNFQNEVVLMMQQMRMDIDSSKGNIKICVNQKEQLQSNGDSGDNGVSDGVVNGAVEENTNVKTC